MALKQTLATWASAVEASDKGDPQASLDCMKEIPEPSSKILYNIGCAYLALGDLVNALRYFSDAIGKDEHMAIAYFERGCVHFKAKRYQDAIEDFLRCQTRFRGRSVIDYGQLDLRYKLYVCESQYNLGVCEANLGKFNSAEENISTASKCKVELRHKYMKDALEAVKKRELPNLAEIPRDAIYRPPKGKVDNLEKRDYLGKATVISSLEQGDGFSGFVGPKKLEQKRRQSTDSALQTTGNERPRSGQNKEALGEHFLNTLSLTPGPTGSMPNSPKAKHKLVRQRSKDDSFIDSKPARPPKSLEVRERSLDSLPGSQSDSGRRLPPPPLRPPPKLDRKPLPPDPESDAGTSKGLVKVEFSCNTTHAVEVKSGTSLEYLVCTACQHYALEKDSINLWKKNSAGQHVPILTEKQMKDTWGEITSSYLLLWCYAKQ